MNFIYSNNQDGLQQAQRVRSKFIHQYPRFKNKIFVGPNNPEDASLYFLKECFHSNHYHENGLHGNHIKNHLFDYKYPVQEISLWHIDFSPGKAHLTSFEKYINHHDIKFLFPT